MKKSFQACAFFFLLASSFFFTLTVSAQEDPNLFLPSAPDVIDQSTAQSDDQNIYLQRGTQKNTPEIAKSPAQVANGKLSGVYTGTTLACPYAFERDLQLNSKGEDVRLLQILLNSDKRTIIALDGAGSPGKESTLFGQSTKVAVKKFQALFIEYVGTANGRFGPRTRTVMNAICNGDTSAGKDVSFNKVESIQKNATPEGEITEIPNDKISPKVSLTANLNIVEAGTVFKVIANFSEEVKPITPDSVIVDGGTVKEIRKLSKTSYSLSITPAEGAKVVTLQVEADKVSDLANNTNENASNEINVRVKPSLAAAVGANDPSVDSLLGKIAASAPSCNYTPQGQLITANPNNGQPLNTSGCAGTNGSNFASFNSQLNCYADNGPLPPNVQEIQRCSNPQNPNSPNNPNNPNSPLNPNNPNNPNSPCSPAVQQQLIQQQQMSSMYGGGYGYSPYGGYGATINPCQNPAVAAATAQQAMQAQQSQGIGQMLGGLLSKGLGSMFGQGANRNGNPGGQQNGGGQVPPGSQQTGPGAGQVPTGCPSTMPEADRLKCEQQKAAANPAMDISKFCDNPENVKSIGAANKNACSAQINAPSSSNIISAVSEKNKPCDKNGFKFYCINGSDTCIDPDKENTLLMSTTFGGKYLISREIDSDKTKLLANEGECIVQNPYLSKNFYSDKKEFTGCSKVRKPDYEKPEQYFPKAKTTGGALAKVDEFYFYTNPLELKGATCPLK